ncbi:MAG: DUF4129 domain-containing protein [Sphingopyxis macrogoltabida]|uniref:DUF4129 domain-containing protein n=1 Tax=Sphingopyxis macrogoltabida TaxID=33050 RepID=A0A2W5NAR2_SPHMC|nr:MAG: DUF4129 domain-containing protein [Sphingopyxis macrogoltabida]
MMSIWIAQASAAAGSSDQGWLVDPELIDPGYGQTIAGGTIQTGFPPPEPPPETPAWLQSLIDGIGNFLGWSAPAFKPIAWIGAALIALFLLYHLVPAFRRVVDDWIARRRRRGTAEEIDLAGQAEAGAARALLAEADALAAEGRFAEAVHLLLYRSVEDIEGRRPGLVRPAMTSRDLAEARDLPAVARGAFSRIARAVEISLFGGRSIDAGAWQQCRDAYSDLTVARNWARA